MTELRHKIELSDIKSCLLSWQECIGGQPSDDTDCELYHGIKEPRPHEYCYGPVVGMSKQICRWIRPTADDRELRRKIGTGAVWVVKHHRTSFEVWFRNEIQYTKVMANRLNDQ